jgi:hypothetical protein
MSEEIQTADALFFGTISATYLAVCAGWLIGVRLWPKLWPAPAQLATEHRWLDLGLTVAAAAAVLLLGQAYWHGYLLPKGVGWLGVLCWTLNNLIIYAPVAAVLLIRRQGPATAFLSPRAAGSKIGWGLVLGVLGVALFLRMRGEITTMPVVLRQSLRAASLANFVPVFLEGVALAFAFVRIRWAFGLWPAVLIPSVLFAVGHVPRQLADGTPVSEMAAFFALNTLLPAAILYVVQRSQDVIWIGIVHYLMDNAIGAFEP